MEDTWTREIFWNVGADKKVIVYSLAAIALGFFFYGIYRRYCLWRRGSGVEERFSFDRLGKRIWFLFLDGLLQRRLLREIYPGLMHAFILWGFIVLFLGTVTIAVQEEITVPLMDRHFLKGSFYLIYKLTLNIAGVLAMVGLLLAAARRYIIRPARLSRSLDNGIVLGWIFLILITGFLLQGLRIYGLKNSWEVWSIGGWIISKTLSSFISQDFSVILLHKATWWVHLILSLGLVAYLPFSRLRHLLASPASVFANAIISPAVLSPIVSFDTPGSCGVSQIKDFTPRQLLDLDACTQCGRCQDNCPAYVSEKPLSPKKVIEHLKAKWLETRSVMRKSEFADGERGEEKGHLNNDVLLDEDVIWSCTLCMACFASCPVYISSFEKLIDLRRDLVMMRSRFFPEIGTLFRDVETFSDTFGKGKALREDWSIGLDVRRISEGDQTDVLLWVGCYGAFHDRIRMIVASLAELFKRSGTDYAILGKEESCCGDPIRRVGNEYLFQSLARRNIELLQRMTFKKIVSYCPHCFNMLKNEYPQFGGTFDVLHYTELLRDSIVDGDLRIATTITQRAVYHDPCYLARANNLHRGPRDLLRTIPGMELLDVGHSRTKTFCCGAGGGHMWMRDIPGKRLNEVRIQELMMSKPETIVTSCPYCLIMFEDAIKCLGIEQTRCMDIVELMTHAI
ncbi:MAG: 4Fe-4S dicluster domain-containing protein [Proteobacteria bacterium]|nr:4Fe-4S dicluster domain-containing protein [Pseudomonadota bacterium]